MLFRSASAKDAIVIYQNGRVDFSRQYLASCGSQMNVVVEGDKISPEQQKSLDTVVGLVASKLGKDTVELADVGKLVSDAIRNGGKYAESTQVASAQRIERDRNNFRGRSNSGEMSQEEAHSRGLGVLKNIFSRLAGHDAQRPYSSGRYTGEGRSFGSGRYVMSFQLVEDWLDELFEGLDKIKNPEARAKALQNRLAKMIKHGKLGKDLAEKITNDPQGYRDQMREFAQMLKTGKPGDEAKFSAIMKDNLPESLQEKIAAKELDKNDRSGIGEKVGHFFHNCKDFCHSITSNFGMRRDPFNGGRRLHKGTDLAYHSNEPVKPGLLENQEGVVKTVGYQRGYGKVVEVSHGVLPNGQELTTFYAHLNRQMVRPGQSVDKDTVIGLSGSTGGRSTGPHLHYEVRVGGVQRNPLEYIGRGIVSMPNTPTKIASDRIRANRG